MNSGSRSLPFVRLIFAALAALLAASGARAAPPFVMDGRYHDLAQLRLAEDEQGTITALDLLFYLDMTRNSLAASDLDLWLAPEAEREEDVWTDIAAATHEFLAMRALGRRSGPASAPDFVKEALLFSAAEAAWIETTIRQEIVVEPADIDRFYIANPGRYIGKARAQIRYIYLPLPGDADVSVQREAENRLGALRDGIVRGETTFEQAAIQNSAAPSAQAGGLIPEFERGTYFPELELQAFRLARPGQLSPVFVGNEGVYLVQLVSKTEETKKPLKEVEAEIRKRLEQTHVGPYYRLHYGRLKADDFHQNFFAIWQYADLGAPVAIAAGRKLTRDEMIRINPGVVNANYEINWNVLGFEVENWLEGVTILHDLKKRGLERHPLIERAEPIADQVIAARAALGKSVDPASVTTVEAARATLARGAGAPEGNQGGLPQSRVVKISLAIDPAAVAQAGREDILREEVREISRSIQRGQIPTTPSPIPFASQWASLAGKTDEEVEETLNEARGAVRASGFSGVVFIIEFMGWHERLPGLSPHPALARLEPGKVARATTLGGGIEHFYVIESRFSTDSPWLEVPLALESAAFDTLRLAVFRTEVKNAEKTGRLLFTVPEKKEAEDEDSEDAGETAAEE